jgi:hypothetical protein
MAATNYENVVHGSALTRLKTKVKIVPRGTASFSQAKTRKECIQHRFGSIRPGDRYQRLERNPEVFTQQKRIARSIKQCMCRSAA